jgi:outer membrane immunogenic protein
MMNIAKALVASLSVFALASGSALAADLGRPPVKALPPAPPPVPVLNWTGCYVDGGGGYGLWNLDQQAITKGGSGLAGATVGGRGWYGTLGGGCDYQAGRWVVGVQGDYNFMDLHGNFSDPAINASSGIFTGTEKERDSWAVGGRIGYLIAPNVLTYWNGGYTQARFDQINMTATAFAVPINVLAHNYDGWFLGGGFETSLGGLLGLSLPPGLFLRTEYRFSSYQPANVTVLNNGVGIPTVFEHLTPYVQTITTALVWKFNWTP